MVLLQERIESRGAKLRMIGSSLFYLSLLIAGTFTPFASAQSDQSAPAESASALPDAPSPAPDSQTAPANPASASQSEEGQQTRRILWIIPNFRSVSVDQRLPPLSADAKFKLMAEDSFDYSDLSTWAYLLESRRLRVLILSFTLDFLPMPATIGTILPTR
jgi:hypothetical protein